MTEEKRLDLLFYELASQSRLDILQTLCNSNLKMQDLARKLDLTATEATRQLQRLSQARLIARLPEGTYATTEYGKLLLALSASIEFVYRYDTYFLEHNVRCLPEPFVNRLGELSTGTLVCDLNQDLSRWEELIDAAEDHVWVMTPQAMGQLSRVMGQKLVKGIKIRSIFDEKVRNQNTNLPSGKSVERKLLPNVGIIIMTSEKEASVSFQRLDANVDFPSFFGSETVFLKWVNDLFLFFWEKGKTWYPK
jgi:predicted transcriptional regulator